MCPLSLMKLAVMGTLPVIRAEGGATVKLSLTSGSLTTTSSLRGDNFTVEMRRLKLKNGMLVKKW